MATMNAPPDFPPDFWSFSGPGSSGRKGCRSAVTARTGPNGAGVEPAERTRRGSLLRTTLVFWFRRTKERFALSATSAEEAGAASTMGLQVAHAAIVFPVWASELRRRSPLAGQPGPDVLQASPCHRVSPGSRFWGRFVSAQVST